jgi:hypothetical protein
MSDEIVFASEGGVARISAGGSQEAALQMEQSSQMWSLRRSQVFEKWRTKGEK